MNGLTLVGFLTLVVILHWLIVQLDDALAERRARRHRKPHPSAAPTAYLPRHALPPRVHVRGRAS